MPLTPLPADNTKRYKMLYSAHSINHSMTARCSSAQTDAVAAGFMTACAVALAPALSSSLTFLGVEVAAMGSNVFNPIGGFTPVPGTGGGLSPVNYPRAYSFPGRTSGGRKTRVEVFGVDDSFPTPGTFEEDPLVTAALQGFQGLLNSQSDFWLGIDGVKPIWYFRCTIKVNDHYVDKAR